MAKSAAPIVKTIATNRKVGHDFHIH